MAIRDPVGGLRSTLIYIALIIGVSGDELLAWCIGAPATLLAIMLAWPQLKRIPRAIIVIVLVAIIAALLADPTQLGAGFMTTTRLAALIAAVMLLAHVLGNSRHLGVISEHLFSGHALTRYLSISFGTLFLAMPLNFGSVSVMSTLIGREIHVNGNSPGTRNASRAVLRGFGSASLCSPLSIAVVLTLTLVPDLTGWQLIAFTFPLAVGYLLSGTVFREHESNTSNTQVRAMPEHVLVSWFFFGGCVALICLGTFVLRALLGLAYAQAVTCSCLMVVAIGLAGNPGHRLPPRLDNIGNELAIIGGSAFLGTTLSVFLSGHLGAAFNLPAWSFPVIALALPWAIFAGGLVGLNPLILVTMIGGLSSRLWPAGAGLGLAVAMVCGWGLTIAGTPYSANALLVQNLTGYNNWRITIEWSLSLSLIAITVASIVGATLTAMLM